MKNQNFSWNTIGQIIAIAFSVLIIWKLWGTEIKSFEFSDFLSLTIALFAIFLSIIFYFKASDISNRFYHNMLHFSKDASVRLSEISERLNAYQKSDIQKVRGQTQKINELPYRMIKYIEALFLSETIDRNKFINNSEEAKNSLISIKESLHPDFIKDLKAYKLIDGSLRINEAGLEVFKWVIEVVFRKN